jgi:hypothetical protein
MRHGVSVVVRSSERNDPGLAGLAEAFGRSLPGEVHVQLYATPAGTHSYGWHYDFEDVFIAQTAGVKDYFFRENTVARETLLGQPMDFAASAGRPARCCRQGCCLVTGSICPPAGGTSSSASQTPSPSRSV